MQLSNIHTKRTMCPKMKLIIIYTNVLQRGFIQWLNDHVLCEIEKEPFLCNITEADDFMIRENTNMKRSCYKW